MAANNNNRRVKIQVNGGKVYDNFDEFFGDFVEDMLANEEPVVPHREENGIDRMAADLFATYKAFIEAGFTKEQAFELLLAVVE